MNEADKKQREKEEGRRRRRRRRRRRGMWVEGEIRGELNSSW